MLPALNKNIIFHKFICSVPLATPAAYVQLEAAAAARDVKRVITPLRSTNASCAPVGSAFFTLEWKKKHESAAREIFLQHRLVNAPRSRMRRKYDDARSNPLGAGKLPQCATDPRASCRTFLRSAVRDRPRHARLVRRYRFA